MSAKATPEVAGGLGFREEGTTKRVTGYSNPEKVYRSYIRVYRVKK